MAAALPACLAVTCLVSFERAGGWWTQLVCLYVGGLVA